MTLKSRLVKALEILFSDEQPNKMEKKDQNYETYLAQFTDESNAQKFKELQTMVYRLGSKITEMNEKVDSVSEQITNLTTINEELLHTLDQELEQGFDLEEDKESSLSVHFKAKKYELN